ncbi:MAG: 2-hydroxyacid dehydrogenase, partial [Pseudomonadota bacterium]
RRQHYRQFEREDFMTIKVLKVGGFFPSVAEDLAKEFDVVEAADRDAFAAMSETELADVQGFATFGWAPKDVMERMPALKIVSSFGVGYDGVAADHAAEAGIMVTHTPNVLNDDVANLAIALILMTDRRLVWNDRYVREGRWEKEGNTPLTRSIRGKKVGIVGLGRIGEAIAEKLSVFKCETVYHSRNEKSGVPYTYFGNLTEMAEACDILVAITPGGPATDKLINRGVMDALGPQGTLINIARGSVVDEAEMILALQEGRLGAAGLDVFEKEPIVPEALYAMDNVVLTPHVASATVETRQDMSDLVVENLVTFFKTGNPVAPVPETAHLAKS